MREFTGPGAVKVGSRRQRRERAARAGGAGAGAEAFAVRVGNAFRPTTLGNFVADVRAMAAGLARPRSRAGHPGLRLQPAPATSSPCSTSPSSPPAASWSRSTRATRPTRCRWVRRQQPGDAIVDRGRRAAEAVRRGRRRPSRVQARLRDRVRRPRRAAGPRAGCVAGRPRSADRRRSPMSTSPPSSTPRARPASRRAACSPTAT